MPGIGVLAPSVKRARRRLVRMAAEHRRGEISMEAIQKSVAAWNGHASHGNTKGLRRRLLNGTVIRAGGRSVARGLGEQQSRQRALRLPQPEQPGEP